MELQQQYEMVKGVYILKYNAFQKNLDVIEEKGSIPYWVIANKLCVHENTLRNWMKRDMDLVKKSKVLTAIREIKQELAVS